MKRYEKVTRSDGSTVMVLKDLKRQLNLSYLKYTNMTYAAGAHDSPSLACDTDVLPDFVALYRQPSTYHEASLTAVGFWQYDDVFDGIHGLYNAIYYDDKKLLEGYKERFAGVKIFFTPDYSQFGDIDDIEERYRLKKARVVGIWFAVELGAVVIPFITMPTAASAEIALDGLEDCHVVAFSTKGYATDAVEREMLKEIIRRTVDRLDLKAIAVYDACKDSRAVEDIFSYAIEHGIKIHVPMNTLKARNIAKTNGGDQIEG